MKTLKTKLFATAAAATLVLSPLAVSAQESSLETSIESQLQGMGFEVSDGAMFTAAEVAEIKTVLDGDESSAEQTRQIEQILDTRATWATNGAQSSDKTVTQQLAAYGYDVDPASLTDEQSAELVGILESEDSVAERKRQIEVTLGDTEYKGIQWGTDPGFDLGLRSLIRNELAGWNMDVDVDALSTEQLVEIKGVLEGEESRNAQQQQIRTIIAG